jgi:sporulation protein YlmC with PRC-barrel domain
MNMSGNKMKYDKYIFVDYENVQNMDLDIIDGKIKMLIIAGEHQNRIPISLIQKTQPYGNSIEWLRVKNNGKKNALDFLLIGNNLCNGRKHH